MTLALETLPLFEGPIDIDALSLDLLRHEKDELGHRPWEVRMLVQALEKRSQAQGAGWSRPWNRTGMAIFRADRILPADNHAALSKAILAIRDLAPEPLLSLAFIDDLFADPALVSFVLYHNRESGGAQYEGLTLSFGRPALEDSARLDRLDLILEDRRVDGRVDGRVDLVRILVCPWSAYSLDRDYHRLDLCEPAPDEQQRFDAIYHEWAEAYRACGGDEARRWMHWLTEYSGLFAPRSFVPGGTSFP